MILFSGDKSLYNKSKRTSSIYFGACKLYILSSSAYSCINFNSSFISSFSSIISYNLNSNNSTLGSIIDT